jgi:hypothetical protein
MFAHHSRKVLVAALLATVLSAPVSASDSATTTQQTKVGQAATELAAVETGPIVVRESSATVTNGRIEAPRARPKLTELRPSIAAARPRGGDAGHSGAREQPLILGIAY